VAGIHLPHLGRPAVTGLERARKRLDLAWESFFYAEASTAPGGLFRIAFAILLFVNMGTLGLDLALFYSEEGLLGRTASEAVLSPLAGTLLWWGPPSMALLWTYYGIFMGQIVLLGLGVLPRVQAVCVFFWLCNFQNRNILLMDGEDNVFRLFAFFLILLPTHRYTIAAWWRGHESGPERSSVWHYRLVQVQMCVIYVSTLLEKLTGPEWLDETSMWYVSGLDDLYGKFWVPVLFDYMWGLKLMTWGTLVIEAVVPVALWFSRTRRAAIVVALAFHFGIEISMNLNLFHWIMALGWLTFLVDEDIAWPSLQGRRLVSSSAS
jgi:hypothetical protein